jgi:hypothetical protein
MVAQGAVSFFHESLIDAGFASFLLEPGRPTRTNVDLRLIAKNVLAVAKNGLRTSRLMHDSDCAYN